MKIVKFFTLSLTALVAMGSGSIWAAECALCESIRADNALHHKNYEYYEEYQKTQAPQESAKPQEAPKAAAKTTTPPPVQPANK